MVSKQNVINAIIDDLMQTIDKAIVISDSDMMLAVKQAKKRSYISESEISDEEIIIALLRRFAFMPR